MDRRIKSGLRTEPYGTPHKVASASDSAQQIDEGLQQLSNDKFYNVLLAIHDVSSLHTNIPQEKGIDVVRRYYKDH